jgi:hypothetical protein
LPEIPCVYFAIDGLNQIQYIGRSTNPRKRWQGHHRQKQVGDCRIAYMQCDEALLDEVEAVLIDWFAPPLNGAQMPITDKKVKTRISVAFDDEAYAKLEELALTSKRSVANMAAVLIDAALYPGGRIVAPRQDRRAGRS